MVLPLDILAGSSPVNPVTPFTYRDNATNLTILRALELKLNALIAEFNTAIAENESNTDEAISNLVNSVNLTLANFQAEIEALIEATHEDGLAFNPTNGRRTDGVSRVISDVYDYARVFAYFALQYDELELTAAQYDALQHSARHFDLGVTYPTLNDVQE